MPELDEFRTAGGLGEMIRRVVKENTIELLRDAESDAAVALVPLVGSYSSWRRPTQRSESSQSVSGSS